MGGGGGGGKSVGSRPDRGMVHHLPQQAVLQKQVSLSLHLWNPYLLPLLD